MAEDGQVVEDQGTQVGGVQVVALVARSVESPVDEEAIRLDLLEAVRPLLARGGEGDSRAGERFRRRGGGDRHAGHPADPGDEALEHVDVYHRRIARIYRRQRGIPKDLAHALPVSGNGHGGGLASIGGEQIGKCLRVARPPAGGVPSPWSWR